MISKALFASASLFLLVAAANPLLADSTIFDGTFADSDWTSAVAVDTTTAHNASFTAMQSTTGGDPGSYRSVVMTYGSGGYIYVSHLYNAVSYSAGASGAIASVNFSYNFEETNPPFAGAAVGYSPMLVQDGIVYEGPHTGVMVSGWKALSDPGLAFTNFSNLTATGTAGTLHPDFSATGDPIQFGYITYDSGESPTTSGTDNFQVMIVNAVPEPSTWALLGLGVAALLAVAQRRRAGSV